MRDSSSFGVGIVGVSGGTVHMTTPPLTYYQEVMRTPGLLAYWRLAEGGPTDPTGFVAFDDKGENSATYFNTFGPAAGTQGQPSTLPSDPADRSWRANDTDDRVHLSGDNFGFAGRVPFSVEFLFNADPPGLGEPGAIEGMSVVSRAFSTGGWGLCTGTDPTALEVFRNDLAHAGPNVATTVQSGGSPLLVGHTTHIVYVYDGTNSIFYFNGALQSSTPHPLDVVASGGLTFGRAPAISNFAALGRYDEVAIYNEALDASRVTLHYSASGL
jgi:hypothetical protein